MAVKSVPHHKPKTAAAILGISQAQLYVLLGRGDLSAVKLGSSTLIRDDEIARFQASLPKMESRAHVDKAQQHRVG